MCVEKKFKFDARESVWNSQFNLVTFYRYATTASWTWSWLVGFFDFLYFFLNEIKCVWSALIGSIGARASMYTEAAATAVEISARNPNEREKNVTTQRATEQKRREEN